MATDVRESVLMTGGPSRETIFDSIRLGSEPKGRSCMIVEFWSEKIHISGAKTGSAHRVHLQGCHVRDSNTFYLWGSEKQVTSGDKWVPDHKAKHVRHVFVIWNTHNRRGRMIWSNKSFFLPPHFPV